MSCSPFDIRDYFLRELTDEERRQTKIHLEGCPKCQEELERLRLTEAALLSLRDEEIPQRIGFVSDKVFEPSALRRWWQAFWGSTARLGFAAAAMLSVAIVVAALSRPAPAPAAAALSRADLARLEADFTVRMNRAVAQAVADTEARQDQKTKELLQDVKARIELQDKELRQADETVDYFSKQMSVARILNAREGPGAQQ